MKGTVVIAPTRPAILLLLVSILFASGCGSSTESTSPQPVQQDEAVEISDPKQRAVAARDALFKQLSTRLVGAMSNGGPAAAIEVCSKEAPRFATTVGEEFGVAIGRTSFKLRNPRNAAPEWAKPLIEARSEQPSFVQLPGGGTGALLPIKLKTQCLTCHGQADQIADAVRAKLDELYPRDQAVGFREGELRGWFWVEVPGANRDD